MPRRDRKSTRLNSSHSQTSYAVFCLKKKKQLRDENAHNDKSVHGVLNPTYQAGLRRDAVQPDIEAERKKRDEIEAGKSYCSRRFSGATCDFYFNDTSTTEIYTLSLHDALPI